MDWLESGWKEPDEGLWEVRGDRQHFTHSKVLAWVAADRAVRTVEEMHLDGPVDRYRAMRAEIHADVCAKGYDSERATFTQYYGSRGLDAALLLIPQVGFLPPDDERVRGTLRAVTRELARDGMVLRYDTSDGADGLPGDEGTFVACSFWLGDALVLDGQLEKGREHFEHLLGLTQRRRPAGRGVRPGGRPAAGQRAAGVQPPGAGQLRPQPLRGPPPGAHRPGRGARLHRGRLTGAVRPAPAGAAPGCRRRCPGRPRRPAAR